MAVRAAIVARAPRRTTGRAPENAGAVRRPTAARPASTEAVPRRNPGPTERTLQPRSRSAIQTIAAPAAWRPRRETPPRAGGGRRAWAPATAAIRPVGRRAAAAVPATARCARRPSTATATIAEAASNKRGRITQGKSEPSSEPPTGPIAASFGGALATGGSDPLRPPKVLRYLSACCFGPASCCAGRRATAPSVATSAAARTTARAPANPKTVPPRVTAAGPPPRPQPVERSARRSLPSPRCSIRASRCLPT
jgi:hypothetical protein